VSQTPSPDVYADWLTKDAAAAALGVTPKTIERLAAAGTIHQGATRPQGRGPLRAVYHPDDVARLVQERRTEARAFVLPAGVTSPVSGNGHGRAEALQIAAPELSRSGEDLLKAFAVALRQMSETSQTPAPTLFLTIPEAATLAGLPAADIRRAVEAGELKARKTARGGYRIRRKDLEAF
jgi:excisionase family DNA binding protein